MKNHYANRLSALLSAAANELSAIQGQIWSSYHSGSAMAEFLLECRDSILRGTMTHEQKRQLWCMFAPTGDWDDVTGNVELGNQIFSLIEKLYRKEVIGNPKREP
jgi:hypothetical protein